MTTTDELAILRFDAQTGRVSAVEAVERAVELMEALREDVRELKDELDLANAEDEAQEDECATIMKVLEYVVDKLWRAVDQSGESLRNIVKFEILEEITYESNGIVLLDVDELKTFIENQPG